jgi:hypothetical protein
MYKRQLIFSIFLIGLIFSFQTGKADNYDVASIPDSLLKNAKSVVRENTVGFELMNLNKCRLHEINVITILDQGGEKHLKTEFAYSSEFRIEQIGITFYDKNGILIKKLGRKDLSDVSYDLYGSVYSDYRKLRLNTSPSAYPYTCRYEISYLQDYSYSFLTWEPMEEYDQSIQNGLLTITLPANYKLNYRGTGPVGSIRQTDNNGKVTYEWEIHNIPAFSYEAFAPPEPVGVPRLMLSPSGFAFENYRGNMSDWKHYGQFLGQLMEGRNDISAALAQKIQLLTADIADTIEKIRTVYKYLQNTTRYVSIQIGIGGLQPFAASTVEKYGYGDCKALANYMKTLLEAIHIKSYCSFIDAGKYKNYYDTGFVHDPYNHVIVYVPLNNRDIWLECTSQIMPFGFLGDFTDNRYALVIREDGGKLKRTTDYSGDKSIMSRKAIVQLADDRNAKSKVTTTYTGLNYDEILPLLHADYERQKDYLYDHYIDIPDFKINSFGYEDYPQIYPHAVEKFDLSLINYTSVSGTRMFVPLNLMNHFNYVPKNEPERVNPVHIDQAVMESDSLSFYFPVDYSIEFLPASDSVTNRFGKMIIEISANEGVVRYIRKLVIYRDEYPKESYPEFVEFCRFINKMDGLKMVLVKR